MILRLPPHVSWPLFVILILLVGIGGAFGILFAAGSDGGAQVIDGYYRQASAWDSTAAARARAAELGWRTELQVHDAIEGEPLRAVEFSVFDMGGARLDGLGGTLQLSRPQLAAPVVSIPFVEVDGAYRARVPLTAKGLWDFKVSARRGPTRYETSIRVDIRH